MLVHLIQKKGKVPWVVVLPLLIAVILFMVADGFSWNDKYIGAITLISSGIILFMIDNKRDEIIQGDIVTRSIKLPRKKGINTLMWIDVQYWAILIGVIGVVWMANLLST